MLIIIMFMCISIQEIFEEFYYGKGKGSRKEQHTKEANKQNIGVDNSDKIKRIKDIEKGRITSQ